MNQEPEEIRPAKAQAPIRKSVFIITLVVAAVLVTALVVYRNNHPPERTAANEVASQVPPPDIRPTSEPPPVKQETALAPPPALPTLVSTSAPAASLPVKTATEPAPPRPEPTPYSRDMVARLAQLDLSSGPLTPEQAAAWKQNFQQLVREGASAVPAIREFLEKNLDAPYNASNGGNLLEEPSLRIALLDALRQIGGPEALALSLQTLQATPEPREIAWLARALDQLSPGTYQQTVLDAARAALANATAGKLADRDVGPLFGVLGRYGGTGALADLEGGASRWNYYAAIALADLPDGAGVSALIQMAQNDSSRNGRNAVLPLLAQLAPQSPEAFNVLLEQARQNQIPDAAWQNIASVLAGYRYQIGNPPAEGTALSGDQSWHLWTGQNFFRRREGLSPDQINQLLGVVDQLKAAAAQSLLAQQELQKSRNILAGAP